MNRMFIPTRHGGRERGQANEATCSHDSAALPLVQRRRIWQLEAGRHCSLLGTCLSLHDLHTLGRRARCQIDPQTPAYTLHSWFVDMMAFPNELSKLVDKELEKRHGTVARAVRRARTEQEIEERWKEVAARGHIAAAYWCAMSHPLCSDDLQWRLFGEIHMLSHLCGASRRADLARVHELEVTCAALDGRLAQLKHDHRAVLKDRKRLEDELTLAQREGERSGRRLDIAQRKLDGLASQTLARTLEARVDELERSLREAHASAAKAEAALSEIQHELTQTRVAERRRSEQLRELIAENEALENELTVSVGCPFAVRQDHEGADQAGALCGKRILCIGGRTHLVQHYRALVERRGGEFLHHDGGIEDSLDAVTRSMSTVDVVLCPIDCVSHAATIKVRRACKHLSKEFVTLRSSGLSSFARGIRAIA